MARILLPSYLKEARGRMQDAVLCRRRGREYMRPYLVPRNPDTPAQRAVRGSFRDAVHAWQAMSTGEKNQWNFRARYKAATGYNLFMSHYMKQTCSASYRSASSKQAGSYSTVSLPQRFPSVGNSLCHAEGTNNAGMVCKLPSLE